MKATHYPSNAEIQSFLRPKIDALRRETVYAEFAEPSIPAIRYRERVGEKGFSIRGQPASVVNGRKCQPFDPLGESVHLLWDVDLFPSDGLKRRYDRLKWGIEKGNRRLRELTDSGFVRVDKVPSANPKGGRARLVARITPSGKEFLEACNNQRKGANR